MYDKWMTAETPYPVTYKFPYEPYILAPRTIPRYDVRFFGYGNDKVKSSSKVAVVNTGATDHSSNVVSFSFFLFLFFFF